MIYMLYILECVEVSEEHHLIIELLKKYNFNYGDDTNENNKKDV